MGPRLELLGLLPLLAGQGIGPIVHQDTGVMREWILGNETSLVTIELAMEFERFVFLLLQSCHWHPVL